MLLPFGWISALVGSQLYHSAKEASDANTDLKVNCTESKQFVFDSTCVISLVKRVDRGAAGKAVLSIFALSTK
ncbi:MAG TPA: hypothetical protein DDW43_11115 [Nitrosomonas sp.]|nr:hypothetical protein [Nitrosomonas sp.]